MLVTKRFTKDVKDERKLRSIIGDIMDCSSYDFDELHKFEKNINGYLIFQAKRAKMHIVYGIDEKKQLIFLRAIRNFTQYKKFLGNDYRVKSMMDLLSAS